MIGVKVWGSREEGIKKTQEQKQRNSKEVGAVPGREGDVTRRDLREVDPGVKREWEAKWCARDTDAFWVRLEHAAHSLVWKV